jgi:hypothetical protein
MKTWTRVLAAALMMLGAVQIAAASDEAPPADEPVVSEPAPEATADAPAPEEAK